MANPFKNLGYRRPTSGTGGSDDTQPSPDDYDRLVKAMAARAEQQASWDQIQTYLRNRSLTPEQVAQWMAKYGGKWVKSPDPVLGQRLIYLSQIAQGDLADIAALLGQAIGSASLALSSSADQKSITDLAADQAMVPLADVSSSASPAASLDSPDAPPAESSVSSVNERSTVAQPQNSPQNSLQNSPAPEPTSDDLGEGDQWAVPGRSYRLQGSIFIEDNALPFVLVNGSQPSGPPPLGLLWPPVNQPPSDENP